MVNLAGAGLEEELVDRICRALPLVDRPHHQRLPAAAVARSEHPRHRGGVAHAVGTVHGLDVALLGLFHARRRDQRRLFRVPNVRTAA